MRRRIPAATGFLAAAPSALGRPGIARAAAFSGVMVLATSTSAGAGAAAPTPQQVGLWARALSVDEFVVELVADVDVSSDLRVRPAPMPSVRSSRAAKPPTDETEAAEVAETAEPTPEPPPEEVDPDAWRTQQIAHAGGVGIIRPAGEGLRTIGFHEAALPGALSVTPSWTPVSQFGREAVHSDEAGPAAGLSSLVLPSRGRSQPPATAIDIAMEAGTVVHAPVTGMVESVQSYLLYGVYPDTRVVIRPDANPGLRVVLLHVAGVTAAPGMHLEAGRTPIAAGPTPFPFASQIDRFVQAEIGHPTPHLHIEVRF